MKKDDNIEPLEEEVVESDIPEVDDVVFEEEGETAKDTIKKLREKLKNAELAKMEYLESMQRMKADYVNAKKRDDESKVEMIRYANVHFAEELLPTLDSFEQAMADKEKWESVSKEWRNGVEGIYQKVLGVFNKNNITGFGDIGETFDPNLHHSIQVVETEEKTQDGTIAQVLQKGYKTGEKIIRPAMVAVYETKTE
ncbi:MAG: nucleotide exchange factor GrpE [bacterium]